MGGDNKKKKISFLAALSPCLVLFCAEPKDAAAAAAATVPQLLICRLTPPAIPLFMVHLLYLKKNTACHTAQHGSGKMKSGDKRLVLCYISCAHCQ